MPDSSLRKPGPVVTSWTELQIPLCNTIEDRNSSDGKKWLSLTTYHNPAKTPGFRKAFFGRTIEFPETVWYITAWESQAALDVFERSEDYRLQREEHSQLSCTALKTHHCDIWSFFWNHLGEKIDVIDAFFPPTISKESKANADQARGLVYHFAPGGSRPSAYTSRPTRGWVHGTRDFAGQEAAVLRFMHFWKSDESEREFKASAGITVSPDSRYLTLYDHMMEQLKDAGLLGIKEFHCKLVELPNYYRDPSNYPPNEGGDDS
ncbi:uncharacterized protein BDR25DRAFT_303996, partial [Lindgomyces ingoldianus]